MADSAVVQAGKQMASVGVHSDTASNDPIVESILHTLSPEAVAAGRDACVTPRGLRLGGKNMDEEWVQQAKKKGWPGDMNNGAHCVANLQRLARDGQILQFYRDETRKEGIDPEYMARTFVDAAVANPDARLTRVAFERKGREPISFGLGGNKAFDAGFTVGYLDGVNAEKLPYDPATLPKITTQCVSGKGTGGPCVVAGYVQGAATKKMEVAAR